MIKKAIIMIIALIISINVYSAENNTFPWRKKWNRHELYKMSLTYFEAAQAYEKHNKKNQAMHCYLHAANTSPYSDIGAKSREQLRKNYNKDFSEPKIDEIVSWLKTQPDLTENEKAFIAEFEKTRSGQQQTTNTQTEPGQNQTTEPSNQQQQTQTTEPSNQQQQTQTNEPSNQQQQTQTTEPSNQQQQTESGNNTQSQEGVTDEEIRSRGERIPFNN